MPNLKEVRIRIASVKSTQQITSAMKMVAASKLRRAQNAIIKLRPYAAKLREILQNISASLDMDSRSAFSEYRSPDKVLVVVFSSNRGLCGAFNSNIIKASSNLIREKYSNALDSGNLGLITVGRKATEYFRKRGFNIVASLDTLYDQLTWENIVPIVEGIMLDFAGKKYDRVELVYTQFQNAVVQRVVSEQFLPIEPPKETSFAGVNNQIEYLFIPSKEEIVAELIPKSLKIQFYKAILDSFASEHGARMTAMQQATDNAGKLLKELSLQYNKARQAAITNEILEIVSGAEALKG
jgi:F-type H+-transporting ATPase subunit gamma